MNKTTKKKTNEMPGNRSESDFKAQAKRYKLMAMTTRSAKKKKEYEENAKQLEALASVIEQRRCPDGYETAAFLF